MRAVQDLLRAIGQDPHQPNLHRTPARVVDFLCDLVSGTSRDAARVIADSDRSDYHCATGELVGVTDIFFRSLCEHHLVPFEGRVDIFYLPRERITGIGQVHEVVEVVSHRLQLQERLGQEIADALFTGLEARGVAVSIRARHPCVHGRGRLIQNAPVVTLATVGTVPDDVRSLAILRERERHGDR